MSDGVNTNASGTNDAELVDRTWNPGGAGNERGDRHDTTDATWNPNGAGNATEDEIPGDLDQGDAAEATGE